ncbi:MAG: HEPN domain-containing protein, partial [Dolichospermum sp.]
YLTHYDQSLKSQAANESELYRITEKLKIIICLCLMKELGFDKEEITHFLSNGNVGLLMEWALNESVPLIVDN